MDAVIIIGLPASGKTTLAKKLGGRMVEATHYVRRGMSQEEALSRMQSDLHAAVHACDPVVLSDCWTDADSLERMTRMLQDAGYAVRYIVLDRDALKCRGVNNHRPHYTRAPDSEMGRRAREFVALRWGGKLDTLAKALNVPVEIR